MATPQPSPAPVLLERQDRIARLIINRPPLNILDIATLGELKARLDAALAEPEAGLLEIRGAGEEAFSAGVEVRDHFPGRVQEMLCKFHAVVRTILYAPIPTLAVVRGHCLGGGTELALACDFILASAESQFGQPEIKLGALPPVAAALLPRLLGQKKALEIILRGEPFSAHEACNMGLVNRVVTSSSSGGLDAEVSKFEEGLLSMSPRVLALARKASRQGFCEDFETRLRESERIYLEELLTCEDATEGLKAFLEKRPPAWKGK